MKKIVMTFAAVLCCALVSSTFTACGKDDADKGSTPTDNTPAKVTMTFSTEVSADMLEYFDIVMVYNDGTGEKQDAVTSNKWTKTLIANLPVTMSFKRQITVKPAKYDALVAATKVTTTKKYSYAYDILNAAGKSINLGDSYSGPSSSVDGKGELVAKQANAGKYDSNWTYVFDTNGRLASTVATK